MSGYTADTKAARERAARERLNQALGRGQASWARPEDMAPTISPLQQQASDEAREAWRASLGSRDTPSRSKNMVGVWGAVHQRTTFFLQKYVQDALRVCDDMCFSVSAAEAPDFGDMRRLRAQRAQIQQFCLDRMRMVMLAAQQGQRLHVSDRPSSGLSLLAEEALEEQLFMDTLARDTEQIFQGPLWSIGARLATMFGKQELDMGMNPFHPSVFIEAFHSALPSDMGASLRMIAWKAFKSEVLQHLNALYSDINTLLKEAGLLPDLPEAPAFVFKSSPDARNPYEECVFREETLRASDSSPTPSDASLFSSHASMPPQGGWGRYQNHEGQRQALRAFEDLYRLGVALPSSSSHAIEAPGLLSIVDILMQEIAHKGRPSGPSQEWAGHALRSAMVGRYAHQHAVQPEEVNLGPHALAVDTVGLLFEYVLRDASIPESLRTPLSRLQIPFVRMALCDPELFAQDHHPARALLNTLASVARRWSPLHDRDRHWHKEVESTVERVLRETTEDPTVFAREHQRLTQVLDDADQKSRLHAQRAVEAAQGRARLEEARTHVSQHLNALVSSSPGLPSWLQELMRSTWAHAGVLTWLRSGQTSPEYKRLMTWASDVAWSAHPARTPDDRATIGAKREGLVRIFKEGCHINGMPEQDQDRLAHQLSVFLESCLNPSSLLAKSRFDSGSMATPDVYGFGQNQEVSTPPPAYSEAADALVQNIATGEWWEIQIEQNRVRGRVAWRGGEPSRVLLVSQTGSRLGEILLTDIALQIDQGTAWQIDARPLFDAAMEAVIHTLQRRAERAQGHECAEALVATVKTLLARDDLDEEVSEQEASISLSSPPPRRPSF